MSYVVLARKWRPRTFDDLIGQSHVSRTIANAIATERVAHAFLFTGVRGVGKTSSARILAKALNCEQGPTAAPCLECPPCREIADGSDTDVWEIDGASYTGIDDVKKLQEQLPYQPQRDRFRIVIVDEVHMLSEKAWNAFLKTLEEPPPHVKFIFATTEAHKVPVTILSRCQRYDFKLITVADIAARLRYVLDQEGVAAEDEAVRIVAREAAGSMRDAVSLLDQVIAWAGGSTESLSADTVSSVLGVAKRSVHHQLGAALVDGDAATCLDVVADVARQGFGIASVARDFLEHLRDLVVAKVSPHPGKLLDTADSELADLMALAERASADDLSRLYLGFSRAFDDIVRSAQARGALEMALVRLARRPPLLPLDDLLQRLGDLERRLGAPSAGGAPSPGGASSAGGAPPGGSGAHGGGTGHGGRQASAGSPSGAREAQPARPHVASFARRIDDPSREHLQRIFGAVAEEKAVVASMLEHGSPLLVEPGRLVLAYEPGSFLLHQIQQHDGLTLLRDAAEAHFGVKTVVEIDTTGREAEVETLAARAQAERAARQEQARREVADHPLVRLAMDVLGAELRDVRLPATEP